MYISHCRIEPIELSAGCGITVSGRLNCSSRKALIPICWTWASDAGVGPNEDCSRNRAPVSQVAGKGGGGAGASVTGDCADTSGEATDVALTVTIGLAGSEAGGV